MLRTWELVQATGHFKRGCIAVLNEKLGESFYRLADVSLAIGVFQLLGVFSLGLILASTLREWTSLLLIISRSFWW